MLAPICGHDKWQLQTSCYSGTQPLRHPGTRPPYQGDDALGDLGQRIALQIARVFQRQIARRLLHGGILHRIPDRDGEIGMSNVLQLNTVSALRAAIASATSLFSRSVLIITCGIPARP